MRTQPVRTVTLPRIPPEPQIDLIPEINECLQALSIFELHERAGLRLHGIAAVRQYFLDRFKAGL